MVCYLVEESDNEGYTVTKSGDTGIIKDGETAEVQFINHRDDEPAPTPRPDYPNEPLDPETPVNSDKASAFADKTPKTGDASNLSLWLILMGASCMGVISALVGFIKQREGARHSK